MIKTNFLLISSVAAFTAVAFGAFGAHGLKTHLTPELMAVYQTAVDYHMWHALGLGLIGAWMHRIPQSQLLHWAGWIMLSGIFLFSGSLYLLAITGHKWLGMITPFGGLAFLVAWSLVITFSIKTKR